MNVLITGSSRGLGRSLALAFAKAGHALILNGRDAERLNGVYLEIKENQSRGGVAIIMGDIWRPETIDDLARAAEHAGIDILVNNAGVYAGTTREIITTNLIAPIRLTLAIYPGMVARGGGLIVNVNSLAGKTFNADEAAYCASKWGLRGFMGSFKYEARKHGVNVLDVYLGAMKTEATKDRAGWDSFIDPDEAADQIVRLCGAGKSLAVTEIEIVRAGG